jgi:hypothetical protein
MRQLNFDGGKREKIMNWMRLFALALFLSVFNHGLLLSIVEEKWKPYKEAEINRNNLESKKSDAEIRRKEAEKESKDAEQKKEKAKTEAEKTRADEELNEARLKLDQAQYDVNTVDIAEAQNKWDTSLSPEQQEAKLKSAQMAREAAVARSPEILDKISGQLAQSFETKIDVTRAPDLREFHQNVVDAIAQGFDVNDKLYIFGNELFSINARYPDYAKQREALVQLHDIATSQAIKGRELGNQDQEFSFDALAKQVADRIAEIDGYLKKQVEYVEPPRGVPPGIESELHLATKIPSDQVRSIAAKFVEETTSRENLKQLSEALDAYRLDDRADALKRALADTTRSLATEPEIPVSQDVKVVQAQTEEGNPGFIDEVVMSGETGQTAKLVEALTPAKDETGNWIIDSIKVVAQRIRLTAQDIGRAVKNFLVTKGGALKETFGNMREIIAKKTLGWSEKLQAYADKFLQAPELAEQTLTALKNVDDVTSKWQGRVRMVPGKDAQKVAQSMETAERYAKIGLKYQEYIKKFARSSGTIGKGFQKAADFFEYVGNKIRDQQSVASQKREESLRTLNSAKVSIERARADLFSQQKLQEQVAGEKPIAFGDVTDFFGGTLAKWAREKIFGTAEDAFNKKLAKATDVYGRAQKDYLDFLFTKEELLKNPQPTAELIQQKLTELLNNPFYDEVGFKKVTDALAGAMGDLSQVHREVIDQLNSAFINIEFLINAWDSYVDTSQIPSDDILAMVNTIFQIRDMKLAELSAAQKGIDTLRTDIEAAAVGTDFQDIARVFTERITRMISGQMIDTINASEAQARQLEDAIGKSVQQLNALIKQQQPNIGDIP